MRNYMRSLLLVGWALIIMPYGTWGQSRSYAERAKATSNQSNTVNSSNSFHTTKQFRKQTHADGLKTQSTFSGTTTTRSITQHEDIPQYSSDRIFIKFKEDSAIQPFTNPHQRSLATAQPAVSKVLQKAGVNQMSKVAHGKKFRSLSNVYVAKIETHSDIDEALAAFNSLPDVEYAEKVPLYRTFYEPSDAAFADGSQYSLELTQALQAFDLQDESVETIYLAIVDDAFLYDHPDLAANVAIEKCYDVADNDADTRPPSSGDNKAGPLTFSHGTHVGGIAGAVTNNDIGMASVSNNSVRIFGIKATKDNTDEPRNIDYSHEGVLKAIENGAKVINMSFGGTSPSVTWQNMIDDATASGVIFVAAAGNGNTAALNYPAAYNNVIAVANTNHRDQKEASSHFGNWIDVSAPGADIYSTVAGSDGTSGSYAFYSGTSMASPMVAGLVGLMLSQKPSLTYNQVLSLLTSTADDIEAANPGFVGKLGAGRINAYNALLATKNLSVVPQGKFITSSQEIYVGQTVTFSSQSLGDDLQYTWEFDGGSPSTAHTKSVSVTYNTAGVYHVQLKVSNSKGSDVTALNNLIIVREPMECALLDFPYPGTRSLYNFTDDNEESIGPVVGQNGYEITQFANRYEYLPGYYISGGLFGINKVVSKNPGAAKITFKIWQKTNSSGIPGNVIASKEVLYKDLLETGFQTDKGDRENFTEIVFDNAVKVPDNGVFFMGFEVYYNVGDTVAFYTNDAGEGNGNYSYFYSEEGWESFGATGFEANIEISPVIMDQAYLDVAPFAAEAGACIGGKVTFNTEAIKNAIGYTWYFEGGSPATSNEANPSVTYPTAGEFGVKLLVAIQGCSEGRRKIEGKVLIVDCEQEPISDFNVDRYIIAEGDSVLFMEQALNATGFSWVFEGGEPATSGFENPYVTYTEPGIYEVRLETSNPKGGVASMVKKDYITVLESTDCEFYSEIKLNDPLPGSPTLYHSDDGYVAGTNSLGDLGKVQYFKGVSSKAYLNKMEVYFGAAHASQPQSSVEVILYDNKGFNGGPGNLIASQKINLSDIENDVEKEQVTTIFFDDNILVRGPFYAGISLDLISENDTVALVSSRDDEVEGTAWEMSAVGSWIPVRDNWQSNGGTNPLDIAFHVSVHLQQVNLFASPDCTPLSVEDSPVAESATIIAYPNPFDQEMTIEYTIRKYGWVRLELFNSMGQLVKVLVEGNQPQGTHHAALDGSLLARGLYIYRLSIGGKPIGSGRAVRF